MMSALKPFTVVIPARFGSSRLPGKPLADIAGKPMVQYVYERALGSRADRVIIATDDERIMSMAEGFGAEVCMTQASHPSGTDRLQEVASLYGMSDDDVIVNVQGDEPLIPSSVINQVADNIYDALEAGAATLCERITCREQLFNPNIVKVVSDSKGYALYFSRAPIPWARAEFVDNVASLPEVDCFRRHIGIYAYRVGLLNQYVKWGVSPIEKLEALEQLRLLWHGQRIHVADAVETPPHGVDTEQDLVHVRSILEQGEGRGAVMSIKVLFVCLGNICRSPTAHGVFIKQLADAGLSEKVVVDSAGTSGWHNGGLPDIRSSQEARMSGYDLSFIRSRQVQPDDFIDQDLILAMDQDNLQVLKSNCPEKVSAENSAVS